MPLRAEPKAAEPRWCSGAHASRWYLATDYASADIQNWTSAAPADNDIIATPMTSVCQGGPALREAFGFIDRQRRPPGAFATGSSKPEIPGSGKAHAKHLSTPHACRNCKSRSM